MDQLMDQNADNDTPVPWLWRTIVRLEAWARPVWGWGVLVASMLISMLPAVALRANHLLALGTFQTILEMVGPLAVATVWLLWGWRQQRRAHFGWWAVVAAVVIGAFLLSQLLLEWLPGPWAIWNSPKRRFA